MNVVWIDWRRNPRSILHLIWNVAFVLLVSYGIYTQDPFRIDTEASRCASGKPLYVYFVHFATKFTYPAVYLLQSGHIFLHGRALVRLLDSPCFRSFYASPRRARVAFALFLLANHLFFVAVMFDRLKLKRLLGSDNYVWLPSTSDLLTYLCLYVVFQFVYWLYIALHYAQTGILGSLAALEQRVRLQLKQTKKKKKEKDTGPVKDTPMMMMMSEEKEALIRSELRSLALTSEQLSVLLSWPLLTYLFLTVSNIVLVICLAIICQPNIRLAVHIIFSCTYANFIATINGRIRRKVGTLLEMLRAQYGEPETQDTDKSVASLSSSSSGSRSKEATLPPTPALVAWTIIQMEEPSAAEQLSTTTTTGGGKRPEPVESRRIRVQELELYEPLFHLKVFQLSDIDYRFIFKSGLFVLGYVVFLSQTH